MKQDNAPREFHLSRKARDRYQFDQTLFSTTGTIVLANFHAVRIFTQKMNDKRDLLYYPEQTVRSSQINAMGMIDEILHVVISEYRRQKNPELLSRALDWLNTKGSQGDLDRVLHQFTDEFPPISVYRNEKTIEEYLLGKTDGVPNRQLLLEELVVLWLENMNPAFGVGQELFDDSELARTSPYHGLIQELHAFLETQPFFGPDPQNLITMLGSPARVAPHSLSGQLDYIREQWGFLLTTHLYRLLSSLDFIREEEKPIFFGPGPARVPLYDLEVDREEPERFSHDRDWMPRLVLLAKNAHVWLDQLSRKYQRSITRLDQIPDEELGLLSEQGFTGLWLIGLWQRSKASQQIKQRCGNPDAVASAYSIFEYEISEDLGGPAALKDLKSRTAQWGLRLASDMVPNHTALDSKWVIEHPDWFISLDHSPFPSYRFEGPNLSWDDRVGLFLEDHYYQRTDAAVVFKRVDFWTGSEQYICHGNDGTNMPWNDTAQLNYLHSEVREAVIQTILHVARNFSIIRFDAAMTLAKRHYQRLWFPEPGNGGAIPSRADQGMPGHRFHELFPEEFWREVVNRVAQEVPDTLLLAEAFWLMEGYFVRTLGMHRVYNSAFMNMLRDEENAKYKAVMKNTLEFDPEVLKRFVNFMNNPDERTAVDQFGSGDKYFGICTLLATLPGLPMFGHGQLEGLAEKYGMEYHRAYWDEVPNKELIERHEREIFPLLHRRAVFAEVSDFLLYDFWTEDGQVNDDVFAFSNSLGDERALIVYHNRYKHAQGWISTSVGFASKEIDGSKKTLQKTLGEGFALTPESGYFTIFRDLRTGLEYIRSSKDLCEHGLYVEIAAYKCFVFIDFREVHDNELHHYAHLTAYLDGRGVPSIETAMIEILLRPVHRPFEELMNPVFLRRLYDARVTVKDQSPDVAIMQEVEGKAETLFLALCEFTGGKGDPKTLARDLRERMTTALCFPVLSSRQNKAPLKVLLNDDICQWGILFGWLFVHTIGKVITKADFVQVSLSWLDEWQLGRRLAGVLCDLGYDEKGSDYAVTLVKLLTSQQRWFDCRSPGRRKELLESIFRDESGQRVLQINRHRGVLWLNQEAFEQTLGWLYVIARIQEGTTHEDGVFAEGSDLVEFLMDLCCRARDSGYQVEKLMNQL